MSGRITDLPKYEFNIRSFHPNKSFGWSGLFFSGDNRGFSLKPSKNPKVTSRIWHRLEVDYARASLIKETKSDPSKAPWADSYKSYELEALSPKSDIFFFDKNINRQGIVGFKLEGRYRGSNHAMPLSTELQKATGKTYVPSINVKYRINIDFDKINKHVDLVVYITGDGFPNCEAFMVGPGGTRLFLGTHVREGIAPRRLALNLDSPMIACAVRLPVDSKGQLTGKVGDELARRAENRRNIQFEDIESWNQRFLNRSPNHDRCMLTEELNIRGCLG